MIIIKVDNEKRLTSVQVKPDGYVLQEGEHKCSVVRNPENNKSELHLPEDIIKSVGGGSESEFEGFGDPSTGSVVDYYDEQDIEVLNAISSVKIPDSVEVIKQGFFQKFANLEIINIGEHSKLRHLYPRTFEFCSNLREVIIPNLEQTVGIGIAAFAECRSIEEIHIPEHLLFIADSAFDSCRSLKKINLPDGMLGIGDSAFQMCFGLTEINIPIESAKRIRGNPFEACPQLKTIRIILNDPNEEFDYEKYEEWVFVMDQAIWNHHKLDIVTIIREEYERMMAAEQEADIDSSDIAVMDRDTGISDSEVKAAGEILEEKKKDKPDQEQEEI